MTNPFLELEQQDLRRSNPNYLRHCWEGRHKFDGITTDQEVLVGVKGSGNPEGQLYREVVGILHTLGAYEVCVGSEVIEIHQVARVTLLEEPNPFF